MTSSFEPASFSALSDDIDIVSGAKFGMRTFYGDIMKLCITLVSAIKLRELFS